MNNIDIKELKNKKILVIVESPNKVKHVKEYLHAAGYKLATVMASVGHIMELANGGDYYNSGVNPNKNFELNLKVSADKKDVVSKLKSAVNTSDMTYVMTDPDREGFVIAWSLIKFLNLKKGTYFRAVTHEITPKAVVYAIEHPIEMDENLVDAGLTRMTIDKMLGFRLSPIARSCINAKSVGRCQSAGLKLIVDREKEIKNFIPEKYFELCLTFKKNGDSFKAKFVGNSEIQTSKLNKKEDVLKIIAACNGKYIIDGVSRKEKKESPKPPFCTATFQQEVNSKLGLSVKDAMSCAQKLFENGNITYIRTDDTDMSLEFIPMLKQYVENNYGEHDCVAPRKVKKQEGAQEGHECLRITDPALTPDLFNKNNQNTLLQKVYKIIWQRTIASVLPDAIISETGYLIDNNDQKFLMTSSEILDEGYRRVYSYKDTDDAETNLPIKNTFSQGEELQDTKLDIAEKSTQPPARFKEATFIKELQKQEIGRPSTYATIVETVLSKTRNYCTLDSKKCLVPTDKGIELIDFLDKSFSNIINIGWTREMEKGLDDIAAGKKPYISFLTDFYNSLESTIKSNADMPQNDAKKCPLCGANMVIRRSKYGKSFYGCSNFPKCRGLIPIK